MPWFMTSVSPSWPKIEIKMRARAHARARERSDQTRLYSIISTAITVASAVLHRNRTHRRDTYSSCRDASLGNFGTAPILDRKELGVVGLEAGQE